MASDAAEARAARQREIDAYVKAFESGAVGSGSADDPLRAMFPSSFGKTGKGGRRADGDSGDEAAFALTRKTDGAGAAKDGGRVGGSQARPTGRAGDDDDNDDLPDKPPTVVKGAPADDDTVGPMPPPRRAGNGEDDDDDDDDFDDDDDADSEGKGGAEDDLPITHEALLKDHTRAISAMTLEHSGARLLTGSYDYNIKMWDFAGMDASLRSFRTTTPCGSHRIADVQWSLTGDRYLVAPASAQAKCFDREGKELFEGVRGDMYLRDMNNTKGHIAALTGCAWHPTDRETYLTSSEDFTIRLWDVADFRKQKAVLVAKAAQPGQRMSVSSAGFSRDGKLVVGGVHNGSIKLWPMAGPYHRPSLEVSGHVPGKPITSVVFATDNHSLLTRSGDGTMKLWDIRNFKAAVGAVGDLPNDEDRLDAVFSPDERYLLTGTTVQRNEGHGHLLVVDRNTFQLVKQTAVTQSSVTRLLWHPRLNQIFVGSANGTVSAFYSPSTSVRGVKLCVVRAAKRTEPDVQIKYSPDMVIITPHALPLFRDTAVRNTKRQMEKIRKDPIKSHKPELPMSGPGRGGRIGGAFNFTHHVMKTLTKDTTRDEDPREALLKYAKVAEADPKWVAHAYQNTQPTPIFAAEPPPELDADGEPVAKRRK